LDSARDSTSGELCHPTSFFAISSLKLGLGTMAINHGKLSDNFSVICFFSGIPLVN
jgi:hypothetical protein